MDLKSELTDAQAEKVVVEKEVHEQLLQLHALQLQLHAKAGQTVDSGSIKDRMVCTFIQLALHLALYTCFRSLLGFALNSRPLFVLSGGVTFIIFSTNMPAITAF